MAKAKGKRGNSEGSIYQLKDGSWMAALTTGRDPTTGKLKRRYFKADTRQEAHQRLTEAQGQYITGTITDPSSMTVETWAGIWWREYVVGHKALGTVEEYERQIRCHIIPALGHLRLQALRVEHVQRFINRLHTAGMAWNSLSNAVKVLRAMAKQAVKNRLLLINPVDGAVLGAEPPREYDFLSLAEARQFLHTVRESPWCPLWALAIYAGLRIGELRGLRWADVDFEAGHIHVRQQLIRVSLRADGTREPKQLHIEVPPKSRAGVRTIPIDADVMTMLKVLKAQQAPQGMLFVPSYKATDFVFTPSVMSTRDFTSPRDGPLAPQTVERNLRRDLRQAGFDPLRVHDLRHTYATLLLHLNVDIKTIQYLLGHARIATTERYLHIIQKRGPVKERFALQEDAARRLGNALRVAASS